MKFYKLFVFSIRVVPFVSFAMEKTAELPAHPTVSKAQKIGILQKSMSIVFLFYRLIYPLLRKKQLQDIFYSYYFPFQSNEQKLN